MLVSLPSYFFQCSHSLSPTHRHRMTDTLLKKTWNCKLSIYPSILWWNMPGRVTQSAGHLTRKSGVLGSIPGLATYFLLPLFQEGSCRLLAKVCARLGGLSLPRKSVVRLTDRPDMTLDVYVDVKQQCNNNNNNNFWWNISFTLLLHNMIMVLSQLLQLCRAAVWSDPPSRHMTS